MKSVYLCIDFDKYTITDVTNELKEQGDVNKWILGNSVEKVNMCDEFWCFGDCSKLDAHRKARELGKDIWQML